MNGKEDVKTGLVMVMVSKSYQRCKNTETLQLVRWLNAQITVEESRLDTESAKSSFTRKHANDTIFFQDVYK